MMDALDRLGAALDRVLLGCACLLLALMMLHVTADVVGRFLFQAPIVGTLETVSYYYMVGAIFLPLAFVERQGEHIRVDLFAQRLPRTVQLGLYLLACAAGLVFIGMMFWQSLHDAMRSTARGETIMSNFLFYVWPARWFLPVGLGAMALAIALNVIRALRRRTPL
jgi:TRAP-type C4-dicarboxylate transport system permease small subunit